MTELVIRDASENWQHSRDKIAALVMSAGHDIRLDYAPARKRSASAQRHDAVAAATADVLFLFDDDSLMHLTCAEEIMGVYEKDTGGIIAAVSAEETDWIPDAELELNAIQKRVSGVPKRKRSRLVSWIFREVFLMSSAKHFVPYDFGRPLMAAGRTVPGQDPEKVRTIPLVGGFSMTVRRVVAQQENFDDTLMASSPGEDLDVSYRFTRLGLNVIARGALLHHFEADSGRVKRKLNTTLSIMNSAFLIHKHGSLRQAKRSYYILGARRLLAEFLKDILSGRFTAPQFRGVVSGLSKAPRIFSQPQVELGPWYEDFQLFVLSSTKRK